MTVPNWMPKIHQIISGKSRGQKLKAIEEVEKNTGLDQSVIHHTFDDGWTIRAPYTEGDLWREGSLMNNCIGEEGGDPQQEVYGQPYLSLRDPDNYPRVSWSKGWDNGPLIEEILGHGNSWPKPQYWQKIYDFARTQGGFRYAEPVSYFGDNPDSNEYNKQIVDLLNPEHWEQTHPSLIPGYGRPNPEPVHPNQMQIFTKKLAYEWTQTLDGQTRWGPLGAAGILFHHPETNTYLLAHRSPEVDQGDTWSIPGGAIDPGEEPYQAALREAEEEFGHVPQHTVTGIHKAAPVPDWAYHTVMADVPEQFEPEYDHSWETQGHGWFNPEEMQRLNLHPGFASAWNSGALTKQGAAPQLSFSTGGDQIGPEYHGYHVAFDGDKQVGKLDYTYLNGENGIRMVEVDPAYRRQGIADALLERLKQEDPNTPIYSQGDYNTPEGQVWLDKHGISQWNDEDPQTFSKVGKNSALFI